jgi:glycosyltransferase involved in cell wall biosynthesis
METYARRLVPALAQARPDLELTAFLNWEAHARLRPGDLGDVQHVLVEASGRSRARRILAEQLLLPRRIREHRIDLLHSFGGTTPARPGVPTVLTLYDVTYARHPEAHTRAMRAGLRVLVPLAVRSADRIVTISQASAVDIEELLGVPRERIDVVYPGGLEPGPATPEAEFRARLALGTAPLVLSVSARRPHKNLARLLRAFAAVRGEPEPVLVLPGYTTPFEDDLASEARALGIAERVRFLGWVSSEDLEGLYAAASCFVFPSLAEGFGLPVLEALERGVPVACSSASSLPEVAGDAARYFDPLDPADIAAAIQQLLDDRPFAAQLVEAGREQAGRFSWERSARELGAVYDRV